MKKIIALLVLAFALAVSGCTAAQRPSAAPSASSQAPVSSTAPQPTPKPAVELNIAAAASLTESLTKLAELYAKTAPEVTLTFNFAASGALQTQIEEGAPADVFISAAEKQMTALADKGLILDGTNKKLLLNKVVLVVPTASTLGLTSFEDCLTDKVKLIAVGDPASVPVGQYTKEIFTSLNGWDTIQAKANLATNVKEVLAWTETGNVDCGIVYSTDAAASSGVKIVAEAPEGTHKPVIYPAAVVKATAHEAEARAFWEYLSSDEAKKVFLDHGFAISK